MADPIQVSKANVYSVLSPPANAVVVSKANVYSVLQEATPPPQGGSQPLLMVIT